MKVSVSLAAFTAGTALLVACDPLASSAVQDEPATDTADTTEPEREVPDGSDQGQRTSDPAWPEGMFGSVEMSGETGDLGGFEIRFYQEHDRPMAEFTLCEGWCNESFHSPVSRDGDAFVVEHIETLIGPKGPEPHQVRFRLTPVATGLRFESWYDGQQLPWGDNYILPPIDAALGLDIANNPD